MARIRTVKPEFWEDEGIGLLTRDARLLFIATLNLADDEGLLRWSAPYLKANVFMYDDDIDEGSVLLLMKELDEGGFIFAYTAGRARQSLGYIVNFRRHQNINRPGVTRLTPPSIQSGETLQMYRRRDRDICHLCGGLVTSDHDKPRTWASLDHIKPRVHGGDDSPSNIKLSHVSCNKSRRDRPIEEFTGSPLSRSVGASVNDSELDDAAASEHSLAEVGSGTGNRERGTEQGVENAADKSALSPKPRGTRIPTDWRPDDDLRAWTVAEGLTVDRARVELEKFRDYWTAKSGQSATKHDWPATWRNWVRRVLDEAPTANGHRGKPTSTTDDRVRQALALMEGSA